MDALTVFGVAAVTSMLIFYALEERAPRSSGTPIRVRLLLFAMGVARTLQRARGRRRGG